MTSAPLQCGFGRPVQPCRATSDHHQHAEGCCVPARPRSSPPAAGRGPRRRGAGCPMSCLITASDGTFAVWSLDVLRESASQLESSDDVVLVETPGKRVPGPSGSRWHISVHRRNVRPSHARRRLGAGTAPRHFGAELWIVNPTLNYGPNESDRLLDWNGAYYQCTHCNAAYGGFNDVRQHSRRGRTSCSAWRTGSAQVR